MNIGNCEELAFDTACVNMRHGHMKYVLRRISMWVAAIVAQACAMGCILRRILGTSMRHGHLKYVVGQVCAMGRHLKYVVGPQTMCAVFNWIPQL